MRRYFGAIVPLEQTLNDQGAYANIATDRETPMNVAKWLLLALLALPLLELAVFIAVAATIGFLWALLLVLATSFAGALVLRHAGGNHIARVRVAMGQGSFTALQADGQGRPVLLAGILLLIPGFITDILGLLLLIAPLRQALGALSVRLRRQRADGVVDLEPEQWHRVPDPALPDRRDTERRRRQTANPCSPWVAMLANRRRKGYGACGKESS